MEPIPTESSTVTLMRVKEQRADSSPNLEIENGEIVGGAGSHPQPDALMNSSTLVRRGIVKLMHVV